MKSEELKLRKEELEVERLKAYLKAKELEFNFLMMEKEMDVFVEGGFESLMASWYSEVCLAECKLRLKIDM